MPEVTTDQSTDVETSSSTMEQAEIIIKNVLKGIIRKVMNQEDELAAAMKHLEESDKSARQLLQTTLEKIKQDPLQNYQILDQVLSNPANLHITLEDSQESKDIELLQQKIDQQIANSLTSISQINPNDPQRSTYQAKLITYVTDSI